MLAAGPVVLAVLDRHTNVALSGHEVYAATVGGMSATEPAADLAIACMDWVAERCAYRTRIGQQSKSLGGQETMAFIVKNVPDFVAAALQPYRRVVTP